MTTVKNANSALPEASATSLSAPAGQTALLGSNWTEQDQLLCDLWLAGATPQAIAAQLGRSPQAVLTRAARLALPRRSAPGRKPQGGRLPQPPRQPLSMAQLEAALAADGATTAREPEFPPAAQPLQRLCLMCLKAFASQGRHNRICLPCKDSAAYQAGARLPDVDIGMG
jgi:hypothetical protein